MSRLRAIWRLTVAVLLYPLAFAALIWIAWTGKSVWMGVGVIAVVLFADQTWLFLIRRIFSRPKN